MKHDNQIDADHEDVVQIDFADPDQVRAWLSGRRGRKIALSRLCGVHKTSVEGWWYRGKIPAKHVQTIIRNWGGL